MRTSRSCLGQGRPLSHAPDDQAQSLGPGGGARPLPGTPLTLESEAASTMRQASIAGARTWAVLGGAGRAIDSQGRTLGVLAGDQHRCGAR